MYAYSKAAPYKNYVQLFIMNDTSDIEKILRSLKEEVSPPDTFRANARIRVINTVTNPHPLRASWYRRPRVLGYTLGTAIATVVLSVGTVYASQSSLPDNSLYPIKVLSEKVALTLSPTESLKTTVATTIISRRIDEVQKAQIQGDQKEIDASVDNLNTDVAQLQQRKDISHDAIETVLTQHQTFINSLEHRDGENKKSDQQKESEHEESTGITPTPAPTPQSEIRDPQVTGASNNRRGDD